MWVLGGYKRLSGTGSDTRSSFYNDVWYSSNGSNWIQATSSANWSERWGLKCLVFEDKIWVLGGQADGETKNIL